MSETYLPKERWQVKIRVKEVLVMSLLGASS